MKKLFIFTVIFITFSFSIINSQPILEWTKRFSVELDGNVSQVRVSSQGIVSNGHVLYDSSYSSVTKFNLSGDTIWQKYDYIPQQKSSSYTGALCVLENKNKVFYFSTNLGQQNGRLVIRNYLDGSLIDTISYSTSISLERYGDSVMAVTFGYNSVAHIIDENGNVIKSFPLNERIVGNTTPKVRGNYLWVFGGFYDPAMQGFVIKHRISDGALIWRKNFPGSIRFFGDVDTSGNSYVGLSMSYSSLMKFRLVKLTSGSGNVIWDKEVVPNGTDQANTENFVNFVATRDNRVIIGGQIERDSLQNTFRKAGAFFCFDANNGDSLSFTRIVVDTAAKLNSSTSAEFDNEGNLIVLGPIYDPSYNPKTVGYLRKYTNIITNIGENNGSQKFNDFHLSQNYPNPFNPKTTINFQLPTKSKVTLKIYDVLGKEVTTLVNEIEITAKQIMKMKKKINELLAKHTLQKKQRLLKKHCLFRVNQHVRPVKTINYLWASIIK